MCIKVGYWRWNNKLDKLSEKLRLKIMIMIMIMIMVQPQQSPRFYCHPAILIAFANLKMLRI